MGSFIRIGLVDEHSLFRAGVVHALQTSGSVSIVAEGGTAEEALGMAADPTLDVLLLEIGMTGAGIETVRTIHAKQSKAKVVVLTASENEDLVVDALRAGARGYILKDVNSAALVQAIECVHKGEPYVAPALASRLLSRLATRTNTNRLPVNQQSVNGVGLTHRERQVLEFLSQGHTNREIASKLGISIKTVKQHAMVLFSKMGVRNRVEAMAAAAERSARSGFALRPDAGPRQVPAT